MADTPNVASNVTPQQARIDFSGFHWLDVRQPDAENFKKIADQYGLPPKIVSNCMQSEHLPKLDSIKGVLFLILRVYDAKSPADSDTVQGLTRKVAVFCTDQFLVTIHRDESLFITEIFEKFQATQAQNLNLKTEDILYELVSAVAKSFEGPVLQSLQRLEEFESEIFGTGTRKKFALKKGYFLKRQVFVFRRMLRSLSEVLKQLPPRFSDLLVQIDNTYFYADEITNSIENLLSLHVSLSSQRTNEASHRVNEVMRVLTIFSVFFLPLNFIAGVYGMNFKYMPELESTMGYPVILAVMALVALGIFFWFRAQGWLK